MTIRKRASVHHKTVEEFSKGEVTPIHQRKLKSQRPTSSQVKTITVDRKLWAVVLRQAGGDPSRIRIVSEHECYIY